MDLTLTLMKYSVSNTEKQANSLKTYIKEDTHRQNKYIFSLNISLNGNKMKRLSNSVLLNDKSYNQPLGINYAIAHEFIFNREN